MNEVKYILIKNTRLILMRRVLKFIYLIIYFFLSSVIFPNGLLFAKSTNTGAATNIEE